MKGPFTKGLAAAWIAAVTVIGCAGDPADPMHVIDEDTTVPGGEIQGTRVAAGSTLRIDGTELIVDGDFIVERDASVEGLQNPLILIVRGDLTVSGEITSAGHLAVVSDDDSKPTLDDLDADSDENGVDVTVAPAGVVVPARNWNVNGVMAPGHVGANGEDGGRLLVNVHGNLNVEPEEEGESLTINVPDGEDGEDAAGCDVQGGDGGKGGHLNITVRGGRLRLKNVTFAGGNGGMGGDAIGTNCASGSHNIAGAGGEGGSFRVAAKLAKGFDVDGTITFSGWNSGSGGAASITGADGEPGADVMADGGQGQDVSGRSLIVKPGINYKTGASIVIDIGDGGDGGAATSAGGRGGQGVCDQGTGIATPSFDGGDATSAGGKGGDVDVSVSVPAGVPVNTAGAFEAGDGGTAEAGGGAGGNGVDCAVQGGAGGHGGAALTVGGDAGVSTEGANGAAGIDDATGGPGGLGGNAEDTGGRGGDGGPALGASSQGGNGGKGGDAFMQGGDGGNGGCVGGTGGLGGNGQIPGNPGTNC